MVDLVPKSNVHCEYHILYKMTTTIDNTFHLTRRLDRNSHKVLPFPLEGFPSIVDGICVSESLVESRQIVSHGTPLSVGVPNVIDLQTGFRSTGPSSVQLGSSAC